MADHVPETLHYHNVALAVRRCARDDMPVPGSNLVLGIYESDVLALRVRRDLVPAQAWATLFHELSHHLLETSGGAMDTGAEGLCDWFGWAVVDLLAQNPDLQHQFLKDMGGGV